jgi:hypothetical protein
MAKTKCESLKYYIDIIYSVEEDEKSEVYVKEGRFYYTFIPNYKPEKYSIKDYYIGCEAEYKDILNRLCATAAEI